jgi:hypothetical protein
MCFMNKPEHLTNPGGAIPNCTSGSNLLPRSCMPFLPTKSSARALAVYVPQLLLLLFLTPSQRCFRPQRRFSLVLISFYLCVSSSLSPPNSSSHSESQTAKDVRASYDALVDIFECIENFLRRLSIYTEIPPTPVMTEIVIKIMAELITVLALATKQMKQGRFSTSALSNNCSWLILW